MRRILISALLLGCSSGTSGTPPGDGGLTNSDSGTATNVATLPGSPACAGELCWFFPPNFGDDLNAVWAAGDKDMWAVGDRGTIVHYDGAQWTRMSAGTNNLSAVWGSGPNSLWAVGASNTVLRYNGTWAPVAGAPTGSFSKIAAVSDSDVWILGASDAAHFDGASWTSQKLPSPVIDAKRVGSELWVLTSGSVLRYASPGAPPTTVALPGAKTKGAYTALAAASATKAWAVGTEGTAAFFDGTAFQPLAVGTTDIRYAAVLPNGDVFGISQSSVFRLGATRWDRLVNVSGNPNVTENLKHAFVSADGHFWAVGSGGATAFYNGAQWFEAGGRLSSSINMVHGTSSDDVWLANQFDVRHFSGGKWAGGSSLSQVSFPSDVFATAPSEAWVISGVFHDSLVQTKGWVNQKLGGKFVDLGGVAPNDVWVTGTSLMHYDGSTWATVTAPGAPHTAVYAAAAKDIWLGTATGVERGDGATWSTIDTGLTGAPVTIRGTSASDVWAVYGTDVRHFNGTTWESRPAPAGFNVRGLTAVANNDAWAWGKAGAALHYTGGSWVEVPVPTAGETSTVWAHGADLWIGTSEGGVLRKK